MAFLKSYALPRLIQWAVVIFIGTTVTFIIPRLLPSDPIEAPPEAEESDPDNARSLCETFRTLSSAQRDVLLLRQVVGLTPTEVAERLHKTEAAVNTCHHRARLAAVRSLTSLGSTPATRR